MGGAGYKAQKKTGEWGCEKNIFQNGDGGRGPNFGILNMVIWKKLRGDWGLRAAVSKNRDGGTTPLSSLCNPPPMTY